MGLDIPSCRFHLLPLYLAAPEGKSKAQGGETMSGQSTKRPARRGWRLVFGAGCVGAVAFGAFCWARGGAAPKVPTTPTTARARVATTPAPRLDPAEYTNRVVAYLYESVPVTRADLGAYLIARHGADKLDLLINKRILEEAARAQGIEVTAADVENALAEDLKELKINREGFVKNVLKNYGKNLYEWREDVLRPKLLLHRLCRGRVQVTEEDVQAAFQATYGEKVDCRMIVWNKDEREKAMAQYARIRDNEEEFDFVARHQSGSKLASTGGRITPVGRGTLGNKEVEDKLFRLRPGEMTELIFGGQEHKEEAFVLKCDRHLPANTAVNLEGARPDLIKQITEKKIQALIPTVLQELQAQARPVNLLKAAQEGKVDAPPGPEPIATVATFNGQPAITRVELGEFLIARYGTERLDLYVNRRLIEDACKAQQIEVGDTEVAEALAEDLRQMNVDEEHFVKNVLKAQKTTLLEYKEDAIRPRLQLRKLCKDRVRYTEEDVRAAFEAYFGEKVDCRMILWSRGEEKFALMEYAKIRDSEQEFDHKARHQASNTLATKAGKLGPLGRHTIGNDELEREIFRLQPGEVSRLIGTPEGTVVVKCDGRIPARTDVSLESVRADLVKEIVEKKTQLEIPKLVAELRQKANPKLMLKDQDSPEDLAGSVKQLLSEGKDGR
jgi:hypothetical protein